MIFGNSKDVVNEVNEWFRPWGLIRHMFIFAVAFLFAMCVPRTGLWQAQGFNVLITLTNVGTFVC